MTVDTLADRLVARSGERVLFEYVFVPELAPVVAPRPYFHPVRTLGGTVITDHAPEDHRWHLGLAHSWPVVDGWNFWGGPTYVRDRGYVQLDNLGTTRHLGWDGLVESLEWRDGSDTVIALERRVVREPEIDAAASAWWLDVETDVRNTSEAAIRFGSPTTEGRPMAGYAGFAWRGPEPLKHARVLLDDGSALGDEAMGVRSRWLGYVGSGITVAFFEHPLNPGVPNRWFVRTTQYPLVTASPLFDTELHLSPSDHLRMRTRVLIADGEWETDRLSAAASSWPG
jgi:hypothetical protein